MEEKEIIKRAKHGDKEAFSELYRKYDPKIERFTYQRVSDVEEAEDIISEIWTKTFIHLKNFQGEFENSFGAWIFSITRNCLRDYYRKKKEHPITKVENVSDLSLSEDFTMNDWFDQERIETFIRQLPSKQQQIIRMKYFDDLKNKEIAATLSLSEKTVSSALNKALHKLSRIRE